MLKYISAEVAKFDSGKEKSIAISDVKNKLKKRSDVINKRGPMKAVHPVDNIQKRRGRSPSFKPVEIIRRNSRLIDNISSNAY